MQSMLQKSEIDVNVKFTIYCLLIKMQLHEGLCLCEINSMGDKLNTTNNLHICFEYVFSLLFVVQIVNCASRPLSLPLTLQWQCAHNHYY